VLWLTTDIIAVMEGASWRAKRGQSLIGPCVLSHHRFRRIDGDHGGPKLLKEERHHDPRGQDIFTLLETTYTSVQASIRDL
jgi:hypothetical protein